MNKKFLAKLLIFCLVFTMLPVSAFAADTDASGVSGAYTIELDTALEVTVGEQGKNITVSIKDSTYNILDDTSNLTIEWQISAGSDYIDLAVAPENSLTATVTAKNTVTAQQEATIQVTVKAGDNELGVATCKVTVNPANEAKVTVEVTAANNVTTLKPGAKTQLTANVTAGDKPVEGATVTWTSSDTGVATVDENGLVTAVKEGTATITATYKDTENKLYEKTIDINVSNVNYALTLDKTTAAVKVNGNADPIQLKATVKADSETANLPAVVWTVDNENIAIIDGAGETAFVKGVAYGTATVTATLQGTDVTATCTITVEYEPVTVIFNAGEGATVAPATMTTNTQGKLTSLPTPTKDGFDFIGWYEEEEPSEDARVATEDDIYTQNKTLYALWSEQKPLTATVIPNSDGTATATISGSANYAGDAGENVSGTSSTITFDAKTTDGSAKTVDVNIASTTAASFKDANKTVVIVTDAGTVSLDPTAMNKLATTAQNNISQQLVLSVKNTTDKHSNNTAILASVELTLTVNGNPVLPEDASDNGEIKVTIKVDGLANVTDFYVYFVKGSEYRRVEADKDNSEVTFTTTHFSEYIVTTEKQAHEVTIYPGNGAVDNTPRKDYVAISNDSQYTMPAEPAKKSGYTFKGWKIAGVDDTYAVGYDVAISSDITITGQWDGGDGGTSGGGGSSSSNVTIASKVTGGTVSISPSRPNRGQTVTINVKPATGYKLDTLTVTDKDGNKLELTKVSDDKYTFVMPAGKVTVTPTFVKTDSTENPGTSTGLTFSDVKADAWYAEYIAYVVEKGMMNGYEDGRFGPNDSTTRAQIVTVLYRLEGEPATSSASFRDVSGGQYYSNAVAWAANNGIVKGYENGAFGPSDNVTREQIAAILYRYAEYKEYDVTATGNVNNFSDSAKVSSWATDAMNWAIGEGLINGDNGALRPQGNATRAEIATLLTRFCENIAK